MLIWGDNKLVIATLLEQFRGKVDLIYIDPPFNVGTDFSMQVALGEKEDAIQKKQSVIETLAYRDTWGKGTDSYLHMMYERLVLMRDLLTEMGSICVHCDWHASHFIKALLLNIFGKDNYRNEIIWWYYNKMQGNVGQFAANHDVIIWFSKSPSFQYQAIREPREIPKIQQKRVWDSNTQSLKQARDENGELIYYTETERTIDDVWRIPHLMPADKIENWRYNTQKPVELVGRIIDALTKEGYLILDAFCGSGTTLVAAEGLRVRRLKNKKEFYIAPSRRWIGIDLSRFSIHLSRKRLIEIQRTIFTNGNTYRPFDVYNLGRYERQWWQMDRLKGADGEHRRIVLQFYKAASLEHPPNPLLHGKKHGAYIYVDQIDSIFSCEKLQATVAAVRAAGGQELHCLAWEFEMELAAKKQAMEAETGITINLKYIPREIMEPNCNKVQFFEIGFLEALAVKKGKKVEVELVRFTPSLPEALEAEMIALRERAMRSPFDFIDFWAVDFEYTDGKPFEHHWQNFRTHRDRSLKIRTDAAWKYELKGRHQICVKVIDVFGMDTTTVITVEI